MNRNGHNKGQLEVAAELAILLDALGRRGRLIALARGTALFAAAALTAGTLLLLVMGWWGGTFLRIAGWTVAVSAAFAVLVFSLLGPLRALSSREKVARRVGRAIPEADSLIRSAAQLAEAGLDHRFSESLVRLHLERAVERLSLVRGKTVFPTVVLLVPAAVLLAAVGLAGGAAVGAPRVMESGSRVLLRDLEIDQRVTPRRKARSPVLGDLSVTLRYPDYLGREERRLQDTSGGFAAPHGTTVVIEGRTLVPGVKGGEIHLPGGGSRRLSVRDEGYAVGRFVVSAGGELRISLETADGVLDGPPRRIEIEDDAAPTVRLLRPVSDIEADEDGEVVLEFEAQDDHGVSRVDLVLRGERGGEIRKTVMRVADRVPRVQSRYRWSPGSQRLDESGELTLELEAFDDDTIRGPKPGRSRALGVRVMTRKSRHARALAQQGEVLDALVDLLAERLERPPETAHRTPEQIRERFTLMRSLTEDLLGKTARLIHRLNGDPLSSRAVADTFVAIREDLSNQLLHEARLHRDPPADYKTRQGVDRVTVRIIEDAIIRVDDQVLDQQFGDLVGGGARMEQARLELLELLERYRRTRAESARRAVLDALDALERMATELAADMETVRGKVGDVFVNPGALDVVDLSGLLTDLRRLMAEGDAEGAVALARGMEERLSRLVTGLETGRMAFRTDRFGEGEKFIGELMDRLFALEADQLQLRRKTIALRRRVQEKVIELMKGKIDPLVKRQMASVERLRGEISEAGRDGTGLMDAEVSAAARVVARELDLALGQGDLDEARNAARDLSELFEDAAEEVAADKVGQLVAMKGRCDGILSELDAAFPRPSQLFGERDRRLTRNQAAKQRHLHGRVRKIEAWIKSQGEVTSFLSHRALGELDSIGDSMGDGVSHLEGKRGARCPGEPDRGPGLAGASASGSAAGRRGRAARVEAGDPQGGGRAAGSGRVPGARGAPAGHPGGHARRAAERLRRRHQEVL